ncbi:hypothetical protein KBK19_10480 [Microvirga sp. STR05]|uniref:DUF4890 domain-containing protein n=1 Tax=Hymenobacter duratus TaxID=2771356 RepID=A0ABR8JF13_9BACT|nr:hypothetical protein [Hymenobacter duratus]MBD2715461.1 hypothetical protein [Hymenobacter duratus]MBR7950369.1 hypothetical protein [Microvirga sp. STR05]
MKKMLVVLAAFALTAGAVSAQTTAQPGRMGQGRTHDAARTPEQHADMQTKRLTQQLSLSADQSAKVRELALAENQELQALRGKFAAADSRKGAGQEMKAIQAKYDAQLKSVFSAEQYTKYLQMREERMDKRKEKMKEGKMKQKS